MGVLPVRRHGFSYLPPPARHWGRKRAAAGPIWSLGSAGYSAFWILATSCGVVQVQVGGLDEMRDRDRAGPAGGAST